MVLCVCYVHIYILYMHQSNLFRVSICWHRKHGTEELPLCCSSSQLSSPHQTMPLWEQPTWCYWIVLPLTHPCKFMCHCKQILNCRVPCTHLRSPSVTTHILFHHLIRESTHHLSQSAGHHHYHHFLLHDFWFQGLQPIQIFNELHRWLMKLRPAGHARHA